MYPKVCVQGTPYEIGKQFGNHCKEQVLKCIGYYKEVFEGVQIPWEIAYERAKKYIPVIESYDRELIEEMQGIADAVGVDLVTIITINARSEIMFSAEAIDGCTSVSVTPKSSDGNTYLGQNWDHFDRFQDVLVIVEIVQENKPSILMVTEAGIIGKIGINNAGIGVCFNALGSDGTPGGLPIHLALRGILNSRNIGEAIGASIQQKLANAANFQIASHEGCAVDIEVSNDGFDVMFNESGIFVHTNHFFSPRLEVKDRGQMLVPDTHVRLGIARRELEQVNMVNVKELQKVFSNHVNYPDSICRHGESANISKGKRGTCLETVFSIISDVTNKAIYVADGVPCQTQFQSFTFSESEAVQ